jgi:hypothetical protein
MLENDPTLIDIPAELGQVDQEKTKNHQTYILHYLSEHPISATEEANRQFVLQEVSGQRQTQRFDSFAQVMNFLLDELLKCKDAN